MYEKFLVDIPVADSRICLNQKTKNGKTTVYVEYIYERKYDQGAGYTKNRRTTIGKRSEDDISKMYPNQNYRKYFPQAEFPEEKSDAARSGSIRFGNYVVLNSIIRSLGLKDILEKCGFSPREAGLFLDFAAYTIITEDNAGQYYPAYAYDHALFTENMKLYTDSKLSDFLRNITTDHTSDFLDAWTASKDHRKKVYVSYDSTNKNTQAGDLEIAEYGKAKNNAGTPIFNYAIAYDTANKDPLFYEAYPGSINDVSQLKFMVGKSLGYGFRNIGFILDRGYFSRENLDFMDQCGYSFLIMLKGKKKLVRSTLDRIQGSFESKREHYIAEYDVYGKTVVQKLYETDEKKRYFHFYYSTKKRGNEERSLNEHLSSLALYLKSYENKNREFGKDIQKYFELNFDPESGVYLYAKEKNDVIDNEMKYCGYYCLISSENMTAKDALVLYKGRDGSEKLFCGDKSFLGDKSMRTHSDSTTAAKIFIEFVALIIRSVIYSRLKAEKARLGKNPNYMTVPAAIKELEKISLLRMPDKSYRMDHAVTAVQKTILNAFELNADDVIIEAKEIESVLTRKKEEKTDDGKKG